MALFRRTKKEFQSPRRREVVTIHENGDLSTSKVNSQFRRGQTLSGVRKAPIEDESSRRRVHHLALQRRKVGGVFLIAVTASILLLILLTQLTTSVILVSTTSALTQSLQKNEQVYAKEVNEYFGTHPAERLRFLMNGQGLSQYVATTHPEVKSLEIVGTHNFVETELKVTFREPVAGWQIRGNQYYVDSEGVVFEKNYFAQPSVQIVDNSGITPEQGTTVASARLLGFVGKVVSLSKGRGYSAVEAILPAGTTRRLDVRFEKTKPIVRFTIDGGAGEQVDDMARSLKYLSDHRISATYVDVRVGGRVVYK